MVVNGLLVHFRLNMIPQTEREDTCEFILTETMPKQTISAICVWFSLVRRVYGVVSLRCASFHWNGGVDGME